jgi:DNA-binding GntR family transcriptional regulator
MPTVLRSTQCSTRRTQKLVFARVSIPQGSKLLIQGHREHHGIIDAVASRQPAQAETLTREHVVLTRRNFEAVLEKAEFWLEVPGAQLIRRSS